jgi:glucosamine--fructose-6-phosphate aminotransferase (isomerizing)
MHTLLHEINEQPAVLARLVEREWSAIQAVAHEVRQRDIQHVLIAARGTSDNAATYAKYLFGAHNRLPVALAAPSLYTLYGARPKLDRTLVLAISQSGMSPDIVAVVEDARRQGMLTVAITNAPQSTLAQTAERVLSLHAGEEHSVAATKTYTAQLLTLALLSTALAEDDARLAELRALPQAVQVTLDLSEDVQSKAQRYRYMLGCAVIARGLNYATALELALKLKELTYMGATPYSSADFMHGPIAIVDQGYPVILVAPSGQALPDILQLTEELRKRHAELIVISDEQRLLALAQTPLKLPSMVPEWLSPLIAIVPGQLLAYHLAIIKGLDPERPRGLRKVTQTR